MCSKGHADRASRTERPTLGSRAARHVFNDCSSGAAPPRPRPEDLGNVASSDIVHVSADDATGNGRSRNHLTRTRTWTAQSKLDRRIDLSRPPESPSESANACARDPPNSACVPSRNATSALPQRSVDTTSDARSSSLKPSSVCITLTDCGCRKHLRRTLSCELLQKMLTP